MSDSIIFKNIKTALNNAPKNGYMAEFHLQIIKYSDALDKVKGKDFCEELGIGKSFGTEFSKMKKIAKRLKDAGLDTEKI
jgi:hypothetical protein